MFGMRLFCFIWASVCIGVVGFLSQVEPEAPPPFEAPAAMPLAASALALSTDRDGNVVLPKAADGLFYINGRINGRSIRFLIDTGSSDIVLTSQDAAEAQLDTDGGAPSIPVRTAGGLVEMATVALPPFEVAGRRMTGIKAVIADSAGVSLLGQSALGQFGAITLSPDRIVIHPRDKS